LYITIIVVILTAFSTRVSLLSTCCLLDAASSEVKK